MSESMRDFLLSKGIRRVISSLGASDLELNLAAENDFTISLRKILRKYPVLSKKLLKHDGALPMIFQFNPSDFIFETNECGELLVTICRPGYLSPKIRYNIHDRGHVVSLSELKKVFEEENISWSEINAPQSKLPLLFHYGRSDSTVSFFGANISPEDIREVTYAHPELSIHTRSFQICINESDEGDKCLSIYLEYDQEINDANRKKQIEKEYFDSLALINQDFREARRMLTKKDQLQLLTCALGTGPFAKNDIRIKAKYVA